MIALSSKRTLLLLFAVAALLLAAGLYRYNYLPDDTFITLRYARNAIRGEGFVWNSGERVEGYTNFLWLLIITAMGKLGAPLLATARFLSALFSLAILFLLYRYAKPPSENRNESLSIDSPLSRMLPVLILCATPPFLVWSTSGT